MASGAPPPVTPQTAIPPREVVAENWNLRATSTSGTLIRRNVGGMVFGGQEATPDVLRRSAFMRARVEKTGY